MPPVLIDKNEQSQAPEIVETLKRYFSPVKVVNLPHRQFGGTSVTAGDINIPLDDGSLLAIERKTANDFLGSIPNRHIFNQIEVMHNHAKYCAVIITGKLSFSPTDKVIADKRETEWNGASVRATLDLIQLSGCVIRYCPVVEFPIMVREIYEVVNKSDKHSGVFKNRIITFPPVDDRIQFLAQLPDVGLERAQSLLKFAGMMDDNADEEEYGTLAGALHHLSIMSHYGQEARPQHWGPKTILNIRKFFGLASNQYIGVIAETKKKEK